MVTGTYIPIFRRRRTGKTDYSKRKSMLISKSIILCIRISNKHSTFQFIEPKIQGDLVKSGSHSSQLKKLGWNGSGKNLSGLYLTGYLAGKKAKSVGVNDAILYIGRQEFQSGQKLIYGLKGVIDAGVNIPASEDIFSNLEKFKTDTLQKIVEQIDLQYG